MAAPIKNTKTGRTGVTQRMIGSRGGGLKIGEAGGGGEALHVIEGHQHDHEATQGVEGSVAVVGSGKRCP